MQQRFKRLATQLLGTGFFSIVGAGFLNKIVSFLSGVALVRILNMSDYGAYSYALNIINYFVLFNGLGTASCVVQLCVERGGDEHEAEFVYRIVSSIGIIWDILLVLVIVFTALFIPLPIEGTSLILLLLAPFPLFSLLADLQQQRLRSKFLNREYARATNINSIALAVFSVLGAVCGSAAGVSVGRSVAMAASALVTKLIFKVKLYIRPVKAGLAMVIDILKMSVTVCMTNAVSQLLILVGTTLIGVITSDQNLVAMYVAATTIPFALLFLPSMVMTYATPYFIRHAKDRRWVLQKLFLCVLGVGAVTLFVSSAAISGADWLIPFVFGKQYSSSIPSFQILMVAFFVGSTFRVIPGNVLAAHRRYGLNFISSLISLLFAVIATWVFVPSMGIIGAALGYLVAMIVGGAMNTICILFVAGKPISANYQTRESLC